MLIGNLYQSAQANRTFKMAMKFNLWQGTGYVQCVFLQNKHDFYSSRRLALVALGQQPTPVVPGNPQRDDKAQRWHPICDKDVHTILDDF